MPNRLMEESLRCSNIPSLAEPEVDRLPGLVYCRVPHPRGSFIAAGWETTDTRFLNHPKPLSSPQTHKTRSSPVNKVGVLVLFNLRFSLVAMHADARMCEYSSYRSEK